jgi:hypothetical protein
MSSPSLLCAQAAHMVRCCAWEGLLVIVRKVVPREPDAFT